MNNVSFLPASTNNKLGLLIPESLMRQNLLSGTSEAITCFAGQGFSQKLQLYMVNYVISVSSLYPRYA